MFTTRAGAASAAKILQKTAKSVNISLPLSRCYELIATKAGYADWHEATICLDKGNGRHPPLTREAGITEILADLGAPTGSAVRRIRPAAYDDLNRRACGILRDAVSELVLSMNHRDDSAAADMAAYRLVASVLNEMARGLRPAARPFLQSAIKGARDLIENFASTAGSPANHREMRRSLDDFSIYGGPPASLAQARSPFSVFVYGPFGAGKSLWLSGQADLHKRGHRKSRTIVIDEGMPPKEYFDVEKGCTVPFAYAWGTGYLQLKAEDDIAGRLIGDDDLVIHRRPSWPAENALILVEILSLVMAAGDQDHALKKAGEAKKETLLIIDGAEPVTELINPWFVGALFATSRKPMLERSPPRFVWGSYVAATSTPASSSTRVVKLTSLDEAVRGINSDELFAPRAKLGSILQQR